MSGGGQVYVGSYTGAIRIPIPTNSTSSTQPNAGRRGDTTSSYVFPIQTSMLEHPTSHNAPKSNFAMPKTKWNIAYANTFEARSPQRGSLSWKFHTAVNFPPTLFQSSPVKCVSFFLDTECSVVNDRVCDVGLKGNINWDLNH